MTPLGIEEDKGKHGGPKLIVRGNEAKQTMRSVPTQEVASGSKYLVEMYEIEESENSQ